MELSVWGLRDSSRVCLESSRLTLKAALRLSIADWRCARDSSGWSDSTEDRCSSTENIMVVVSALILFEMKGSRYMETTVVRYKVQGICTRKAQGTRYYCRTGDSKMHENVTVAVHKLIPFKEKASRYSVYI